VRLQRLTVPFAACFLAQSIPASAQRLSAAVDGSVDLGSALLRQPGLPGSSVLTVAPQLRYATIRGAFSSSAIVARTPENRFTGQGILAGSIYAPPLQRLRWELGAMVSTFGVSNAGPTTSGQLLAREHFTIESGGVFVGGGAATTIHGTDRHTFVAQLGSYYRFDALGRTSLSGAIAYTAADSAAPGELGPRYVDAVFSWQQALSRVELFGEGGTRFGIREAKRATPWVSASVVWWMTPHIGVVGSAGRALADVVRGTPTVRYASVALRFGLTDRPTGNIPSRPRAAPDDDGQGTPRLEVSRGEGGGELRVLHVHAAADSLVEIIADFTDWEPVQLVRDAKNPTSWTLSCVITPGTHRVVLRIDGGSPVVPGNLPRVPDDFGGATGLLTVP
jgi:hypothetical protein